jgi:hypothetical protein
MSTDPRVPASRRTPHPARAAVITLCVAVLLAGAVLAGAALRSPDPGGPAGVGSPGASPASPAPVPSGTAWGAFATSAAPGSIDELEQRMGARFGSFGDYVKLSAAHHFPDPPAVRAKAEGALLYLNINAFFLGPARTKVCYPWSGIAAGRVDGLLRDWAKAIAAFDDSKMVVSFDHEPSVDLPSQPSCGTPPEYVAAYERVVRVFREGGVTAPFVWTMTSSTFRTNRAPSFQPESDSFQIVGVDGYNRGMKRGRPMWNTPARVFVDAHRYAERLGKPLLIGEIGCVPGHPRSAQWFEQAAALLHSWGDVVAIEWNLKPLYSPLSSPSTLATWLAGAARNSS